MQTEPYTPTFSKSEQQAADLGYTITHDGTCVIGPFGRKVALVKTCARKPPVYLRFYIGPKITRKQVRVSRFQAWFKFGVKIYETNQVVRHLDGNSMNNHWDNIGIGTQSENMLDVLKDTRMRTSMNATSHVRKHDHAAIIAHFQEFGFKATMIEFGLTSKGTLSFIINKSHAKAALGSE